MCPWQAQIAGRTQEICFAPPCQATLHGTASSAWDLPQDHHTYARDHSPIPGIATPLQGLLPIAGVVSPSRTVPPHQGAGPHMMRRGRPGKPLQWGNGNVAKQLLPASDSSVPQQLCQITRINTGWSPSRGAGNSQHDVQQGQCLHGASILWGTRGSWGCQHQLWAWKQLPHLASWCQGPFPMPGSALALPHAPDALIHAQPWG